MDHTAFSDSIAALIPRYTRRTEIETARRLLADFAEALRRTGLFMLTHGATVWVCLLGIILGSSVSLADGWSPGPEGRTVRTEGRFERLPDGRILAIGGDSGFDYASPPTEVDVYDPRRNRWEQAVTHMPEGRIWPFTAVLKTGQVLVVGGTLDVAPEAVQRMGWIYTLPSAFAWPVSGSSWDLSIIVLRSPAVRPCRARPLRNHWPASTPRSSHAEP